jgi:dTDP-4-dehydrorhamnose reductase
MNRSNIRVTPAIPRTRLPILITGLAGVPGYNLFPYLRKRFPGQVFAQRRSDHWTLCGDGVLASDMEDSDQLKELLDTHEFACVVNCGGSCALKSCELDPQMAYRVNVSGVENLLRQLEGSSIRLVHLSIDLVYSGVGSGGYVESDPTDPVTMYGKTMVMAEELIQRERSDAAILRISLPMGMSFNGHAGAIDWIQNRFKNGRPATLYFDEIRTPTYCDCLNLAIERVIGSDLSGIYHAGGTRRLSLYQIAQIVNRVGGYDPHLLKGCNRIEAGPMPPRAGDVTMNSSRFNEALQDQLFDPWPLDDRWVPTHREWHFDRENGLPGSKELLAQVLYSNERRPTVDATDFSTLRPQRTNAGR